MSTITSPNFAKYVSQNKDLELAWQDMRKRGTEAASDGVYKETYGRGLSEQGFVDAWNALGGKQITDIGQLSKAEWGMLHYQLHGKGEGRALPTDTFEPKPTASVWANYVQNNTDLALAYTAMRRDGALTAAQTNEYKATYGKGLDEKHFVDGWNRLHPERPITDIGQLNKAEWGRLHYALHGRSENRSLAASAEQAKSVLSTRDVIKTETPDFTSYVTQNKDLELAWQDMRKRGTEAASDGVYKQTYGRGLSEQGFVNAWNALGGKQITDIGQLSKAEWGMLHYQLHGKGEGRALPTKTVSTPTSASVWSNYVHNNRDLALAYRAMTRSGTLTDAQMNEYKAAFGVGLNEKHFIDGWNRLNPERPITDIAQLSTAEWGRLHFELHGKSEGRSLVSSFHQALAAVGLRA